MQRSTHPALDLSFHVLSALHSCKSLFEGPLLQSLGLLKASISRDKTTPNFKAMLNDFLNMCTWPVPDLLAEFQEVLPTLTAQLDVLKQTLTH